MIQVHKQLASVLGVGFVKGGGTVAAIIYCIAWYWLPVVHNMYWQQAAITLAIIIAGTWSAQQVEKIWGKDSSKVVIDEVAGMAIALLYAPHSIFNVVTGLILFRLFDILKPLGIKRMEKFPGGWGVMADDIVSGVYAFILLRLFIWGQAYFLS
jgi:phosphatidylglycerophosphatase A